MPLNLQELFRRYAEIGTHGQFHSRHPQGTRKLLCLASILYGYTRILQGDGVRRPEGMI